MQVGALQVCGCCQVANHTNPKLMNELIVRGKLVGAQQLLDQLFDPGAKPSIRWLRTQTKAKSIPHVRIGHLVFFDLEMVRTALADRNLVRHRLSAPRFQSQG